MMRIGVAKLPRSTVFVTDYVIWCLANLVIFERQSPSVSILPTISIHSPHYAWEKDKRTETSTYWNKGCHLLVCDRENLTETPKNNTEFQPPMSIYRKIWKLFQHRHHTNIQNCMLFGTETSNQVWSTIWTSKHFYSSIYLHHDLQINKTSKSQVLFPVYTPLI